MKFDKSAPIAVTGASGYIAGWIVKKLLDRGHTVHATVREPARQERVEHLHRAASTAPGKLVLFQADLLVPGSFDLAVAGCEVVIHTASPFRIGKIADPEALLVRPALEGTRNVLDAVDRASRVKRVVLTSSVAAVYGDACELANVRSGRFDEAHWNTTSGLDHNPYPYSKVSAEKEAHARAARQTRWQLVSINPGLVLGPSLTKYSASYSVELVTKLARGRFARGAPALHFGCVDVRDVADAHLCAAWAERVADRYVVTAEEMSMLEIAQCMRALDPSNDRLPRREVPKWLVWMLGPVTGGISRKFVENNVGFPLRFDNTRGKSELGLSYRPVAHAIQEQYQQLVEDGRVQAGAERAAA